jgi:hypothetical protein
MVLDQAKSRLRGRARSDEACFLRRLIGLEDALEMARPRSPYRKPLRDVRRKLEERAPP